MIIDVHGHYTTAPKALEVWRNRQIAGIQDAALMPKASELKISDDELRESIETNQLAMMKTRGSDMTIFSPRAMFMAHHIGDFQVSATWAAICNELCYRVSQLFPENFIPAAMLPQSPGVDPATCIPEMVKCVEQYGNVGINLNPDPSGGHWTSPSLADRHWYPIYEKMVELDIPAMVHVSTSCNPCFHTTGAHYLNADTTAVMRMTLAVHALAQPVGAQQFDRTVFEHAGANAREHVGAGARLEDHAVDPATVQDFRQQQPRRPAADDRHLGLHRIRLPKKSVAMPEPGLGQRLAHVEHGVLVQERPWRDRRIPGRAQSRPRALLPVIVPLP